MNNTYVHAGRWSNFIYLQKSLHDSSYGNFRGNTKNFTLDDVNVQKTTQQHQDREQYEDDLGTDTFIYDRYCCFPSAVSSFSMAQFLAPAHLLASYACNTDTILAERPQRLHCGEYGHSRKEKSIQSISPFCPLKTAVIFCHYGQKDTYYY
jgi:hypothetical protein